MPLNDQKINKIGSSIDLVDCIRGRRSHLKLYLVFSHREIEFNDGGIEYCIRSERKIASKRGVDYLIITPEANQSDVLHISIDGNFLMRTNMNGICLSLKYLSPDAIIFHSIINYNQASVMRLILSSVRSFPLFFWAHDLSYACHSITLIRDKKFCGMPLLHSQICNGCRHEATRTALLEFHKKISIFFKAMIFPSTAARDRYNYIYNPPKQILEKQKIIPHFTVHRNKLDALKLQKINKIGIGFFGHNVFHKGWDRFLHLVASMRSNKSYEFFHVGGKKTEDSNITHIAYSESTNSEISLKEICKKNNINIAFFWPITYESYNIMFKQILQTECAILTKSDDLALTESIECEKKVFTFSSFDQLIEFLSDTHNLENVINEASRITYSLTPSKFTFDVFDQPVTYPSSKYS